MTYTRRPRCPADGRLCELIDDGSGFECPHCQRVWLPEVVCL